MKILRHTLIENLTKVIQFQAVEPRFEPRPFGFVVHSHNCDIIHSNGDEVQKAVIGAGGNIMRLDVKQIKSGII